MIKESHRAVVFDFDDTLVDTIGPKWKSHKAAALVYSGLELTDDDLREVWGMPFRPMVRKLYRTDDFDGVLKVIQAHRKQYPKVPHPGSVELVTELRSRGVRLGILTSMSREGIDFDFSHLPFDRSWFDFIQTEDDTDIHKPDHRVFVPAMQKLGEMGLTAVDVLYVGDHHNDYRAARDAELDFVGVATGLVSVAEFQAAGAQAVRSVADLLTEAQ